MYDLPRSSPSYTFPVPNKKKCVIDGAFTEQASAIVCGSDHGQVYVFSTASSVPMQILTAAGKTVEVQAIGVRHDGIYFREKKLRIGQTTTTAEGHFIASSSSAEKSEITVWEKPIKRAKWHPEDNLSNGKVVTILNCLVILAILNWTSGLWAPIASQVRFIKYCSNSVSLL